MANAIAATRKTIQHYSSSLKSQDRSKHLAWIGVRIEALLDGYWHNLPSDFVKREIIADWVTGLEAFTPDEITAACREWLYNEPRKKPNVGDIRKIVLGKRALARSQQSKPEPKREPVSPERAQQILKEAGFNVRRMK